MFRHSLFPCNPGKGRVNIADVDVSQGSAHVGDDISHLLVVDLSELHPLDCVGEGICYILYFLPVQVLPFSCILTMGGTGLVAGFLVTAFDGLAWLQIRFG